MWIGSGAISCVMRLPSEPSCSAPRVETGTHAFISRPSVRMPRLCSQSRSAPATTASTTSLTVPPKAFLTSLKSSSCAGAIAMRRWGEISTFSGVSGAVVRLARTTSASPPSVSRAWATALRGLGGQRGRPQRQAERAPRRAR